MTEMPRYQSKRIVRAAQIERILGPTAEQQTNTPQPVVKYTIVFTDPAFPSIKVEPGFFAREMAQSGDYYVEYDNGYKTHNPKQAFEEGYDKID